MANDFTQSVTSINPRESAIIRSAALQNSHRTSAILSMIRVLNRLNEVEPFFYADVYETLFNQCRVVCHPLLQHFGDNQIFSLEVIIRNPALHESSSVRLFTEYSEMVNVENYVFQSQARSLVCERTTDEMLSNHDADENTKSIADEIIHDLDQFLEDFSDWYHLL